MNPHRTGRAWSYKIGFVLVLVAVYALWRWLG